VKTFKSQIVLASLAGFASLSQAQVAEQKSLNMEGARRVIAAAVTEANSKKTTGVIAVVDAGGNLMALERIDGTFAAGANISIGKARTALLFQKPTKFFEDVVNKGRTAMVALDGFTPLLGGGSMKSSYFGESRLLRSRDCICVSWRCSSEIEVYRKQSTPASHKSSIYCNVKPPKNTPSRYPWTIPKSRPLAV